MDMESIVNGKPKVEPQEQTQAEPAAQEPAEGAPTAPASETHEPKGFVPLSALEAERKGRQDWKEKFIRADEELKQYRQQQPAQPHAPVDQTQNMAMNFSEQLLRLELKDATDIDSNIEKFVDMAKADPALAAGMNASSHPWKYAYTKVKQLEAAREIGDDPASYRARLRAEVEAEVRASLASSSATGVKLPTSLASARSTAPRSAPGFTGPTPFDQIVNNR